MLDKRKDTGRWIINDSPMTEHIHLQMRNLKDRMNPMKYRLTFHSPSQFDSIVSKIKGIRDICKKENINNVIRGPF